jgi:hypothetical protein
MVNIGYGNLSSNSGTSSGTVNSDISVDNTYITPICKRSKDKRIIKYKRYNKEYESKNNSKLWNNIDTMEELLKRIQYDEKNKKTQFVLAKTEKDFEDELEKDFVDENFRIEDERTYGQYYEQNLDEIVEKEIPKTAKEIVEDEGHAKAYLENIKIEGGYLNQTLQLGRQINGLNVFQNNNGLIINANFNFDLSKPKE